MSQEEVPQKTKVRITTPAGPREDVIFEGVFDSFHSESVLAAYASVRKEVCDWLRETIDPPQTVALTYKLLLTEDEEEYFLDAGGGFALLHDVDGSLPKGILKPHQTYRFVLRHVRDALRHNFITRFGADSCDFQRRSMRFYIRMAISYDSITTTHE